MCITCEYTKNTRYINLSHFETFPPGVALANIAFEGGEQQDHGHTLWQKSTPSRRKKLKGLEKELLTIIEIKHVTKKGKKKTKKTLNIPFPMKHEFPRTDGHGGVERRSATLSWGGLALFGKIRPTFWQFLYATPLRTGLKRKKRWFAWQIAFHLFEEEASPLLHCLTTLLPIFTVPYAHSRSYCIYYYPPLRFGSILFLWLPQRCVYLQYQFHFFFTSFDWPLPRPNTHDFWMGILIWK